jgi:hypothetical protein
LSKLKFKPRESGGIGRIRIAREDLEGLEGAIYPLTKVGAYTGLYQPIKLHLGASGKAHSSGFFHCWRLTTRIYKGNQRHVGWYELEVLN